MDNINSNIGILLSSSTGQEARPIIVSILTELNDKYILDNNTFNRDITGLKRDMNTMCSSIGTLIALIQELAENELDAGSEEAEEA